jgi:hypothetical protein
MKEKLDGVVEKHRTEIEAVLTRTGVRLFTPQEK